MVHSCSECGVRKDRPFATVRWQRPNPVDELKVRIVFAGTPCCTYELREYLNEIGDIYTKMVSHAKAKDCTILYDAREISMPSKSCMDEQVAFMQKKDEHTRMFVRKIAILLQPGAVIMRGVLQTLFALKPPACTPVVHTDKVAAYAYLKLV